VTINPASHPTDHAVTTPALQLLQAQNQTLQAQNQALQAQNQALQAQNQALLWQQQRQQRSLTLEPSSVDRLSSLHLIAQQLRSRLDETEMFQALLPELVKILNLTGCQVSLYNQDCTMVSARHESVPTPEPLQASTRRFDFPTDPVVIDHGPSQFCQLEPSEQQAYTVLVWPIDDGLGSLGQLRLERRQPDYFDELTGQFVEQVVMQLAVALRRNRLDQANRAQAVELKHLGQLQEAFLGTVSYELRVPLSNIRMAIQMMTLTLKKETTPEQAIVLSNPALEKILRYLEVLERECDREAKLIQDLLDLQQLDLDTMSIVLSAIDIDAWLPYVMTPFQKRAQEYQQDLTWTIAPDLPPFMCDQITLSRIVSELVTNATKFTPAHERIDLSIISVTQAGELMPHALQIRVENTGVAIPIEEQQRIFEKFSRVAQLDIRKLGGTGLGLALVQKLVQRLGGRMWLDQTAALPTTTLNTTLSTAFVVELPLVVESREARSDSRHSPPQSTEAR
jgi:signal transduction histidine kinase